jgi:hypothetical protein
MNASDCGLLQILEHRYGSQVGWEADDYLHARGSPQAALLHAMLFVPEFAEVGGAIFLIKPGQHFTEERVVSGIQEARAESSEALKRFIDSFNWIELPYLFSNRTGTEHEYDKLADFVSEAWRARLQYLYPSRRFLVRVLPSEETGSVIGIGIEQEL